MIAHRKEIIRLEMSKEDARSLIDILNDAVHPEFQYMNQLASFGAMNKLLPEEVEQRDRLKLHRYNLIQIFLNTLGDVLK